MKKRSDWQRKSTKRIKRKKLDKGIVDFIRIVRHFFKHLPEWISEMEDPRHQSYIIYTQSDLVY